MEIFVILADVRMHVCCSPAFWKVRFISVSSVNTIFGFLHVAEILIFQ